MKALKHARSKAAFPLPVMAMLWCSITVAAQSPTDRCKPPSVIPLASEAPAKLVVDPPLAEPLASRGVVVIQYCAENLHFVPVFGPKALTVSPRVGHLHVSVDDASWVWMDASSNPIILMGLSPGPHKVLLELQDANHQTLDQSTVKFVVPQKPAAKRDHSRHPARSSNHSTRFARGKSRSSVSSSCRGASLVKPSCFEVQPEVRMPKQNAN